MVPYYLFLLLLSNLYEYSEVFRVYFDARQFFFVRLWGKADPGCIGFEVGSYCICRIVQGISIHKFLGGKLGVLVRLSMRSRNTYFAVSITMQNKEIDSVYTMGIYMWMLPWLATTVS